MSIDGGNPQKLERGYIPSSWASDGASWASDETSYLAFEYKTLLSQLKDGGYSGELQRVYLDGVTTPILTLERPVQVQVPPDARPLSMSPDGETILFQQRDVGTLCWRLDVSHLVGQ